MTHCASLHGDSSFYEHMTSWSEFFIVKNFQSQAIALSSSFSDYAGYKKPIDYLGKTDLALKCPAYELAELFMQHDRDIISNNMHKTFLYLSHEKNNELSIYHMSKEAISSHMICNAKKLSYQDISKQLRQYIQSIPSQYLKKINTVYDVVDSYLDLSKRETEAYYLLLRGKSSSAIAKQLSLSPRTVQHYIENIKQKMLCNSTQQLIELGMYLKLNDKIPSALVY